MEVLKWRWRGIEIEPYCFCDPLKDIWSHSWRGPYACSLRILLQLHCWLLYVWNAELCFLAKVLWKPRLALDRGEDNKSGLNYIFFLLIRNIKHKAPFLQDQHTVWLPWILIAFCFMIYSSCKQPHHPQLIFAAGNRACTGSKWKEDFFAQSNNTTRKGLALQVLPVCCGSPSDLLNLQSAVIFKSLCSHCLYPSKPQPWESSSW